MSTPKRVVGWIVGLLVLPVTGLWLLVAQPLCTWHGRSAARADPEALRRHVELLSKTFAPRTYTEATNMARCVAWLDARFKDAGATVTHQTYAVGHTPCCNVSALFPGADARRIVVGAHYDAAVGTPGADDNASGVAALVELARLLRGARLRHTVELVAYCTEEPPCFASENMGSSHHAKALQDQGVKVDAMIALEMVGFFSDAPGSQLFPVPVLRLFYGSRANFIGVIGDLHQRALIRSVKRAMKGSTPLPVKSCAAPAFLPGIDLSDHRSYWAYGIPAAMVTDTAFCRNSAYHQSGDTADTLDYARMADVVVGVYEAVLSLAQPR